MAKIYSLPIVMVLITFLTPAILTAQFAGGLGTEEAPWQISTAEHLNNIRYYLGEEHSDKFFVQTADIELRVAPWNEGEGWIPIGTAVTPFAGNYDGNRKVIFGLTIDRNTDNQGLFGVTDGAVLKNISLRGSVKGRNNTGLLVGRAFDTQITGLWVDDCSVEGNQYVGGVTGFLGNSNISLSYTRGSVTAIAPQSYVGSIAGYKTGSNIVNSNSWMDVTGNQGIIGGLVGYNESGDINNCYHAVGEVSGTDPIGQIGGLVGGHNQGAVIRSYWNVETSGQQASAGGGFGRTTEEMTRPHAENTYEGWEFPPWHEDRDAVNRRYPCVRMRVGGGIVMPPSLFAGGEGTEHDPLLISNSRHLDNVRRYLGEEHRGTFFKQIRDIDLDRNPYNEGEGWEPIGTEGNRFEGNYDGGSYKIYNLFIDRDDDYQGLFGATNNSRLKNIKLINADVTGSRFTGGLVGVTAVTEVSNCYVDGDVSGTFQTGGIVGYNSGSSINRSYSTGNVTAINENSQVGGLVGYNINSPINNSFSRMDVTGSRRDVGGLVGFHQDAQITNCYATGFIEATHDAPFAVTIGGLVGDVQDATVTNSYWNTETTGQTRSSGGGVGTTTERMTYPYDDEAYVEWNFEDIWRDDIFDENDDYPMIDDPYSDFATGSGTEDDPWIIHTANHLYHIRKYLGDNNSDKHFRQFNDIDLGIPPYNEGRGWDPIGFDEINTFQGTYDGNGYTIRNLFINNLAGNNKGLFGWMGGQASVKNLGLEDVNITGDSFIAGIAARLIQQSTIAGCYVTGDITGNNYTGGINSLKGCEENESTFIYDCYSNASITVTEDTEFVFAGGIAAHQLAGEIMRCYTTGVMNFETASENAGAVLGYMHDGSVCQNVFWNTETTMMDRGVGNSDHYAGDNTFDLLSQQTYGQEWDFESKWSIDERETYPYLQWQEEPADHNYPPPLPPTGLTATPYAEAVLLEWDAPDQRMGIPSAYNVYRNGVRVMEVMTEEAQDTGLNHLENYRYTVTALYPEGDALQESMECRAVYASPLEPPPFSGGLGTEEDPWQISTAEQLDGIRDYMEGDYAGSYFILTNDIDLNVPPWNTGQGWEPFGQQLGSSFNSHFDGNGHVIDGLFINRSNTNSQGLFGLVWVGSVRNLGLTNVNVVGQSLVGSLAGRIADETVVEGVYATGNVTGGSMTGGLVGSNMGSSILNSYSAVNVEGVFTSGGFVGMNDAGSLINNCYSYGEVEGDTANIRGFVGYNRDSDILNSYWNTETSGHDDEEMGGLGRTTAQMTYPYDDNTYVQWDFDEIWVADTQNYNQGYPYLAWQNLEPLTRPGRTMVSSWDSMVFLRWYPRGMGWGEVQPDPISRSRRKDFRADINSIKTRSFLGYRVYRDSVLINTDYLITEREGNLYEFIDDEVTNFNEYTYFVTAVYDRGESVPGNSVVGRPEPQEIPLPQNFQVEIGNNIANLNWTEPSYRYPLQLIGYKVFEGGMLISGEEPITARKYVDREAQNGDYRSYSVSAVFNLGESARTEPLLAFINPAGWIKPDYLDFDSQMYVSGQLYRDGHGAASEDDRFWVGVFGPGGIDDCRGIAQNSPEEEAGFMFDHVLGDEDEEGTFFTYRIHDSISGNTYGTGSRLAFEPWGQSDDNNVLFNTRMNLTISVQGNGKTQPSAGVRSYVQGTRINLSATPAEGYTFSHWIIDDVPVYEQQLILRMSRNINTVAVFEQNRYIVRIGVVGNGTTVPAAGHYEYGHGDNVGFLATPDENHEFVSWLIDGQEYLHRKLNIRITDNMMAQARFRPIAVSNIVLSRNTFLITDTSIPHSFVLSARIHPANALDTRIEWESSNIDMATVEEDDNPMSVRVNIPILEDRTGIVRITARTLDRTVRTHCTIISPRTRIDDVVPERFTINDHPYLVNRNINVRGRPRLEIEEGVVLYFSGDTSVNVEGELIANNVTFSGASGERESWEGIYFGEGSDNSQINGATIINARRPLTIESDTLNVNNLNIEGGDFENGNFAVNIFGSSSPRIDSLFISNHVKGIMIDETTDRNGQKRTRKSTERTGIGGQTYRMSTATLSNLRVRNTSESIRDDDVGLTANGEVNLTLTNAEIEDYNTGIFLRNNSEHRAMSTATLSNIRVRNTSESVRTDDVAILVDGEIVLELDDVEIDDYGTGIDYNCTYGGMETTVLTNIRVRNTSESVRNPGIMGINLKNIPYLSTNGISLLGYDTALRITAHEEQRAITTATLTNIRVRNTSESVRPENTGLVLDGNVNCEIDNVFIDEYEVGLHYTNSLADGTATLTNIRVRNTSESVRRGGLAGVILQNLNRVDLGSEQDTVFDIYGYRNGIMITTNDRYRDMTTATLSNIRIRNTSESVRDNEYGLYVDGSVIFYAQDLDIIDYKNGIYQKSFTDQRFSSTATLTNIRVRNTSESVRFPESIGLKFVDLDSLTISSDDGFNEVIGYQYGLHIQATAPERRAITTTCLSNLRVRNSSESIRDRTIGALLEGSLEGEFADNEIEDYDVGIKVVDCSDLVIRNNHLIDCLIGIIINGEEAEPIIANNILELPSFYLINDDTAAFIASLGSQPTIYNNTSYLYHYGLIADNANVEFFNNIVWQEAFNEALIVRQDGMIDNRYNNISHKVYEGDGNISSDPLFTDSEKGDFSLLPESPCIDAGDPDWENDEDGTRADIGAVPYLRAAEPIINPSSTFIEEPINVTITCPTDGTYARYTLDGSEPDEESPVYTQAIQISEQTILKAKAFFTEPHDWNPSLTVQAFYRVSGAPEDLSIQASYDSLLIAWQEPEQDRGGLNITNAGYDSQRQTRGAHLSERQIIGGSHRSLSGYLVYRGSAQEEDFDLITPSIIDTTVYVDRGLEPGVYYYYVASVFEDDMEVPSTTVRAAIRQVPTPRFDPQPTGFTDSLYVSISCDDEDAVIRFTTDGEMPDYDSPEFELPIRLTESTVIRARAFQERVITSEVAVGNYPYLAPPVNTVATAQDSSIHIGWQQPDTEDGRGGRSSRQQSLRRTADVSRNARNLRNPTGIARSAVPTVRSNPTLLGYNVYRDGEKINESLITGENEYIDYDVLFGVEYGYTVTAVYEEGESGRSNKVKAVVIPEDTIKGQLAWVEENNRYEGHVDFYDDEDRLIYVQITPAPAAPQTSIAVVYSHNPSVLTNIPNPSALGCYYSFTADDGGLFSGTVTFRIQMPNVPNDIWFRRGGGTWQTIPHTYDYEAADYTFEVQINFDDMRSDTVEFASDKGGSHTLPVELSSFAASLTANYLVKLRWVSETETNMLGYNVYKSSTDDLDNSKQINRAVIGAANTSVTKNYTFTDEDVLLNEAYYYWLQLVDLDLTNTFVGPIFVEVREDDTPELPELETKLIGAYPNPFNMSTAIRFVIADEEPVSLTVYDLRGRRVRTIINKEELSAGTYSLIWDGYNDNRRPAASGVYFYRMKTESFDESKKLLLLK